MREDLDGHGDGDRVEEVLGGYLQTCGAQPGGQPDGQIVNLGGDGAETTGAVVGRVHGRDHRQQHQENRDREDSRSQTAGENIRTAAGLARTAPVLLVFLLAPLAQGCSSWGNTAKGAAVGAAIGGAAGAVVGMTTTARRSTGSRVIAS